MEKLKTLQRLTDSFHKLPGIGLKSAEKMAYAVLAMSDEDVQEFASSLIDVKNNIHHCKKCGMFTENELCEICSNEERNKKRIIVVSSSKDIVPFEKLGTYDGVYHVLNGAISPIKGITLSDLNVDSLISRIEEDAVEEIILATNPTLDGETTAMYLAKLLEPYNLVVSRLAYGLPMGSNLEYTDSLTLTKALEGRKKVEE